MPEPCPPEFEIAPEVEAALIDGLPVVALESTVISHGLPYPDNLMLADDMESEVRRQGAVPATIGVIEGKIQVGLTRVQREFLATGGQDLRKISLRDFSPALTQGASGGTTVAGTLYAADRVGIKVFATGGIGGVHFDVSKSRRGTHDISTDLPALARYPLVVVCAGAKAILDLAGTLEVLETLGVPVVGYETDEFPAFYSRSSGLKTSTRTNSPAEAAGLARAHWELGFTSAVLIANPPPVEVALSSEQVKESVRTALAEAQEQEIRGQAMTPFLLERVSKITRGASLQANLGLLLNNARLAGEIASALWLQ